MTRGKTRYKYGDHILRERKGRYYVYKLEYENGKARETYVGPLIDVVKTYIKLKDNSGVSPTMRPRDLNPGPPAWQAGVLIQARLRPQDNCG